MAETVKLLPGRDKQTWLKVCLGGENVGEESSGFTSGTVRVLAPER